MITVEPIIISIFFKTIMWLAILLCLIDFLEKLPDKYIKHYELTKKKRNK